MCAGDAPSSVADALGMLERALDFLNGCDAASLPTECQAGALRRLERAGARQLAARSRILAAFDAHGGYEADGQGGARAWLRWQTRVTRGAAVAAVAWARRLAASPQVEKALAAGDISASWAKTICDWSERLPAERRPDAHAILLGAAKAGADLRDLAGLAEEMVQRCGAGGDDEGERFDDRYLRLGITLGGAGRLDGDLSPGCAAAVATVVTALAKRAGPEDTRTAGQRRHDALAEACRRLIAAGMIPGQAGQPARLQLHITLSQLRDMPGAADAEAAWAAARATGPGWLSGPEAQAALCDATLAPVVAGTADPAVLLRMADALLAGPVGPAGGWLRAEALARLRRSLLHMAADALSGPAGLAAWLRRSGGGPAASASFPLGIPVPLDTGQPTPVIPPHVRRSVLVRHPHCAFPGCDEPGSVCHIHHLIPRARGGPTAVHNLVPLCSFHHLVAVHRWGWQLTLRADGTTTAASPDGRRVLHSHGPPAAA